MIYRDFAYLFSHLKCNKYNYKFRSLFVFDISSILKGIFRYDTKLNLLQKGEMDTFLKIYIYIGKG